MTTERTDVYAKVTAQIVEAIEQGKGNLKILGTEMGLRRKTFSPGASTAESMCSSCGLLR